MKTEANKFILYTAPSGAIRLEVLLENETIWLTQKAMAELFGVESNTITYHLKEIYKKAELQIDATTRKISSVQKEGNRNI